jgi:hypothetical protein
MHLLGLGLFELLIGFIVALVAFGPDNTLMAFVQCTEKIRRRVR